MVSADCPNHWRATMNVQPNGPLVTDWDAMHVHGLRQVDLKGLPYERRYMPEVPRTGMRLKLQTALYNKTDIDRMVAKRQLELDARIRHKREKYQAQKRRKDALLKGATDQIEKFSKCSSKKSRTEDKYGEVKLPDVVVQQIMGHLATIEPDGVYGPCLAAYSLASAALVSVKVAAACEVFPPTPLLSSMIALMHVDRSPAMELEQQRG